MEENIVDDGLDALELPRRADTIGQLAWRLIGDGKPDGIDPTALGPLTDALADIGHDILAEAVRNTVLKLAREMSRTTVAREARHSLERMRRVFMQAHAGLLFDVSGVGPIVSRVQRLAAELEVPPETGRAELNVLWVNPEGRTVRMGRRISLPDGRDGVVVQMPRADGKVGVVVDEDSVAYSNGDTEPMAYSDDVG